MREILSRAKRVDNGEWVEGNLIILKDDYEKITAIIISIEYHWMFEEEYSGDIGFMKWCEVSPETLCQYTGLHDKNGKRIWENDIVLCKKCLDGNFVEYHIESGFVEMKYGAYGLHRFKPNAYYRPFKDWLEDYEYEVIGNCFDNPEMLKGE